MLASNYQTAEKRLNINRKVLDNLFLCTKKLKGYQNQLYKNNLILFISVGFRFVDMKKSHMSFTHFSTLSLIYVHW